MKEYLTTILLCAAIILIGIGIHINNFIFIAIGGFLVGIYNAMMYEILKEK